MTETQAQDAQATQTLESSTEQSGEQQTTTQANDNPLLASVSPDYADLIKTKGWTTADDVIASYSNMEKFAGKFSSRGVVIPDGDSPEEWGKIYDKLGRPEAPNGYDFTHINVNELGEPEKQMVDFVKDLGFKHGLSKKQLEGFVSEYDAKISEHEQSAVGETQRSADKLIGELKGEWGNMWEQKVALARNAAKKFGIEGDSLDALETNAGFVPMMKVLAELGESLSEDGFVVGAGEGQTIQTPKQAIQELKELQSDPDYLDNRKNPNRHKILHEKARGLYKQAYPTQE